MAPSNELTTRDKLIIASSKLFPDTNDLLQTDQLIPLVSDWNSLVDIAIYNGIAPVVNKNFNASKSLGKIPEVIVSRLNQVYYKTLSRNILLTNCFKNILSIFSEKEIDVIAMKGMYLSEVIYQDIGLRPISDIDLLVKKDDAEKCRRILLELGYTDSEIMPSELIKETEKHFAPLVKDNISIEIHTKLHNEQFGYRIVTEDFWKNSKRIMLHGVSSLALAPEDLLLHLCIHLDSHNTVNNMQLRHTSDIVNILELFIDKIDWQKFEKRCIDYNCAQIVFKNLLLIKKFYNARIPDDLAQRTNHFYDNDTEEVFLNALRCNTEEMGKRQSDYMASRNLQNLKRVKGFRKKITFLAGDIFPSKAFMYQNYKIKNKKTVYLYYIKRMGIGLAKMATIMKNRIFKPK